jgi:ring-1,2-phenylacetyl-CoA epoxidase subunit PaaE
MSKFHPLRIASVAPQTRDAVVLTFDVPPALRESFRFDHGQHLTLRAIIEGEDVRRSYSICSAVQDGCLRVAVKKSPGGVFSTWVNETLQVGQTVDVMPPLGHFNTRLDPAAVRRYAAFAAGSGITPILSIIKTTLMTEAHSEFTLFYGNRSSGAVIFRDELSDLKDLFLDRFNLVYIMSREPQDIDLLNGRIDRDKADALLRHWIDPTQVDAFFICGPDAMMRAVEAALLARGVDKLRIRVELFAASIPRPTAKTRALPLPGHDEASVAVIIDGVRRDFTLLRSKENIIDGALRQGIELPYSCKGGVCSTCRAKLLEGEVDMDANFALEDYEIARGFVLCCQSYPITDRVVVDFDQVA